MGDESVPLSISAADLRRIGQRRLHNLMLPDDCHTALANDIELFSVRAFALVGAWLAFSRIRMRVTAASVASADVGAASKSRRQWSLVAFRAVQVLCVIQLRPILIFFRPLLVLVRPIHWILAPARVLAWPALIDFVVERFPCFIRRRFPGIPEREAAQAARDLASQVQKVDQFLAERQLEMQTLVSSVDQFLGERHQEMQALAEQLKTSLQAALPPPPWNALPQAGNSVSAKSSVSPLKPPSGKEIRPMTDIVRSRTATPRESDMSTPRKSGLNLLLPDTDPPPNYSPESKRLRHIHPNS
ncbi:hypothetical protein FVE85_8232 [Porphyridium purpureum]|uniref:Uncharacterized protein n=1 Tax=Porphyridium purpureum TaxID=35688 RepID=A0A5J4YLG9_PORPP|nr:hypothetical protein FVE85_8232 [Porphyridium purpureum]|eukprot:POR9631..scf244_11